MSTAIVDARGWQNSFDLKTGERADASGPVAEMAKGVLARHPYPGDMDQESNRWVSDTAIDLIDRYNPRFVFLTYAHQYFSGRYEPMTAQARELMISRSFREVQRFADLTGFTPFVVGTGDMVPLSGLIDVTRIDGLAVCTHWSTRYAGLYGPSPRDMEVLEGHPDIEMIVSREEIGRLFSAAAGQAIKLPEHLMLAREGRAFKTISAIMKTPVMIPSVNSRVPVHAPGHTIGSITEIRSAVESELSKNNVALIVMEGVGLGEFPWPFMPCLNGIEWCCYEPGEAQYLTVTSGRQRFLDHPTGYKYFDDPDETKDYPFSGIFKSVPEDTIGSSLSERSIAVGNRSMFMHMVTGADISVECFARNLYNQGTMAVIHRDDKP